VLNYPRAPAHQRVRALRAARPLLARVNNRKAIPWRVVAWGTGLQVLFAVVILKTRPGYLLFAWLTRVFERLIDFTDDGARFVWGWLYKKDSPPVFLIDILMTIIFFSALMSLLYHFGIMQWIVTGLSKVLRKTMRTSAPLLSSYAPLTNPANFLRA
jgi:CNT family concentrative nucleoside transporter